MEEKNLGDQILFTQPYSEILDEQCITALRDS